MPPIVQSHAAGHLLSPFAQNSFLISLISPATQIENVFPSMHFLFENRQKSHRARSGQCGRCSSTEALWNGHFLSLIETSLINGLILTENVDIAFNFDLIIRAFFILGDMGSSDESIDASLAGPRCQNKCSSGSPSVPEWDFPIPFLQAALSCLHKEFAVNFWASLDRYTTSQQWLLQWRPKKEHKEKEEMKVVVPKGFWRTTSQDQFTPCNCTSIKILYNCFVHFSSKMKDDTHFSPRSVKNYPPRVLNSGHI